MKPFDDVQSPGKGPGSEADEASLADAAFGKLPTLGPIAWLYARTQDRRFLFLADLDWAVMPPIVLDQCRLFMRGKMPHAFVTWAHVDDEVHRRLSLGHPRLAPHEWRSGSHAWLIDVVTPFGGTQEVLADVQRMHFHGRSLRYLSRDAESQRNEVRTFAGVEPEVEDPSPSGKIVH